MTIRKSLVASFGVPVLLAATALAGPTAQQLTPSDGAAGDQFGGAVDGDGATVVVGASLHDEGQTDAGTAYVFVRCRGFLLSQGELRPSELAVSGHYGAAVAVSGDVIAVGAPQRSPGGAVYVFTRTRGVWTQAQKLTPSNAAVGDQFGSAIDTDGGRIVVGAPGRDANTGRVFVFDRGADGSWTETATLRPAGVAAGDVAESFGTSVALNGSTLAAHASGIGTVFVGTLSGPTWTVESSLLPPGSVGAALTCGVALDGDTLAVGSPGDDAKAADAGAVFVYSRVGASWRPTAQLFAAAPAAGAAFGGSVVVRGGALVAGAAGESTGGANAGGAYVFALRSAGWTLDRRVAAPSAAAGDLFGTAVALADGTLVAGAPGRGAGVAFAVDALPEQKLAAADGVGDSFLGSSVALSGDTAVVGADGDDETALDAGAAYVFVRSGGAWTQQAKLLAADGGVSDEFGVAVALSGDTALVGAQLNVGTGAVYVFVRSGATWTQQAKLLAADGNLSDHFGDAVALSGDTALVGARLADPAGSSSGAAYVFVRSGTSWTQQAKLLPADGASGDEFGLAVGLSGDTALVGAAFHDEPVSNAGAAYVFVRSAGVWTQQQKLTASDGASGDDFGFSIAVSGDTAVVGAFFDDDLGSNSGAAYVFVRSGATWTQQAKLLAADGAAGDQFGDAVAVADDVAVVGAFGDDDHGSSSGSAYVFVRSAGVWTQQTKLTASDGAASDQFGQAVALSGDEALVGAPFADARGPSSGAAYVRTLAVPAVAQRQKVTASDGAASDHLGTSVAIEGDTAVLGADAADGIVANSGAAYVFVRSGAVWTLQQKVTAADGVAAAQFGGAVALVGDTLLAGAYRDAGGVGAAYVFVRAGTTWTQQAKLLPEFPQDNFGAAVALSGDTALVGAYLGGRVEVFVRSGTTWSRQATLNVGASLAFGLSVALSGDVALVGDYQFGGAVSGAGSTYVFVRSGAVWTLQQKLTPDDGANLNSFGFSIALQDDVALIGAKGIGGVGAAYEFVRSGDTWTQRQKLVPSSVSSNANFGSSVALDGDTALVGVQFDSAPTAASGSAFVFRRSGETWTERAKVTASDGASGDNFGDAVALSGDAALVGAFRDNDLGVDSGSAYFLALTPDATPLRVANAVPAQWTQGASLDVALAAAGGDAPRQFRVSAGALPAGANVDSQAAKIIGVPLETGDFAFTIECADACGRTATFDAAMHVNSALAVATPRLPGAATERPYAARLAAAGGTGTVSWFLVDGAGTGLTIAPSTGVLVGTPHAAGRFQLTVNAVNSVGAAAQAKTFDLFVGAREDLAKTGTRRELIPQLPQETIRTIDLLEGSTLDVTATAPKSAHAATLTILDPTGAPVVLGGALKTTKSTARIKGFVALATGRHTLVVTPDADAPFGTIALSITARPAKKLKRTVALADGATEKIRFAAPPGSKIKITAVAAKKKTVDPDVVAVGDNSSPDVAGPRVETAGRASASFSTAAGGAFTLTLGTRNATSGDAAVTITIAPPKGYPFVAPDPN